MTPLEKCARDWHFRRYGPSGNPPATFRKLCEEVGELGEAIMKGDSEAIREEAGDVGLVLIHIVRMLCPDSPSLEDAVAASLDKCERRMRPETYREG